ncbi:hypothetical protein VPH35_005129 [Triticum aestivum]
MSSSYSRSAQRCRGPMIPRIGCPDCGVTVKRYISGTDEHNGWVFYRCINHDRGCKFWHWEREYVAYLVEHKFLRGNAAVDAIGWSEDRREELERGHESAAVEQWARGPITEFGMSNNARMLELGAQLLLFLKIVVVVGVVLCGLLVVLILK